MAPHNKISLYIHWPFCKSKCPYCDFNSHVSNEIDAKAWLAAFKAQLDFYKDHLKSKTIDTIFFGGGTPSLAPQSVIAGVLEHIDNNFDLCPDAEITLEANPTSIELEKFAAIKSAGINRISVGIQSMRDKHLRFLGREHSAAQSLQALELAKKYFANTSFDLMYCLPDQPLDEWLDDLTFACSIAKHHISLYQLTIEKGTKFYKQHQLGAFKMPSEDLSADFYDKTVGFLDEKGLRRYEVSNHAAVGYESRHNMAYWQYGEYLGIGPGAHSRLKIGDDYTSIVMHHMPNKWLEHALNAPSIQLQQTLDSNEVLKEKIMMGLRTTQGVDASLLNPTKMNELIEDGFLQVIGDKIRPTDEGFKVLNSVILQLII